MSAQSRQTPAWLIILLVISGLCVVGFCIIAILGAILFPVFSQAREKARQIACLGNLKALAMSQQMYAYDYDGRFPAASRWGDLLRPYVTNPDNYRCPSVAQGQGFGYAMNVNLSRKKPDALSNPDQIPLLYDSSNLAWNAHDPVTSLPTPPRHLQSNSIAFADGHAKAVRSP